MLRGYRLYIAAAVGLTFATIGSGVWVYYLDNPIGEKASASHYHAPSKGVAPPTERVARALEAIEKGQNSEQNEERARRDLDAQEGAWRWTKWAAWAAVVQLIISAVGISFVVQSLRQGQAGLSAARRALRHARVANDISRDAQRAWVAIEAKPQLVRRYGIDGLYFRVDFIARNVGQTPATHFEMEHRIFFLGQTQKNIADEMEEQVELWKSDHSVGPRANLLPNDRETGGIWFSYNTDEVGWWDMGLGTKSAHPMLLAAVFYRTTSRPNKIQLSWRSWYLNSIDEAGHVTSMIPMPSTDLGPDRLCVDQHHGSMVHQEYDVPERA